MFCPKCGKQNNAGVAFCAGCGTALSGSVAAKAKPANAPMNPNAPKPNVPPRAPMNQNAPKPNVPPRAPMNPNAPKPNVPQGAPMNPNAPKPNVPQGAPMNPNAPKPMINPAANRTQAGFAAGNVQKLPNGQIPANPQMKTPLKPAPDVSMKDYMINMSVWFVMAILYGAVAVMLILSLGMKDAVSFASIFNDEAVESVTLNELLSLMAEGNRLFNPTVLSKALSLVVYIFFYSAPVFSVLALAGSLAFKRNIPLHITAATISFLAGAFMIAVVPISFSFIPQINAGLGVKLGLMSDDIALSSFTSLIIMGAVCCVLSVAAVVVAVIFNKRRQKK